MVVPPTTNNEELLNLAKKAARSGNKDGARVMFRQVYDRDKRNEDAMLWLAKIARSEQEREQWLRRVLDQNPDNATAQRALEKLNYNRSARNNRTLIMFGGVAVVMLLIVLALILVFVL